VRRVAEWLGYGVESVRAWVKQADTDGGARPGVTTEELERVKALEQEARELRRANEDVVDGRRLGVEPICRVLQMASST
jgi:transposase